MLAFVHNMHLFSKEEMYITLMSVGLEIFSGNSNATHLPDLNLVIKSNEKKRKEKNWDREGDKSTNDCH